MASDAATKAPLHRLPTLAEILTRRTAAPVDLYSLYLFLQREAAEDALDFWLDATQHQHLCRAYLHDLRRSGQALEREWPSFYRRWRTHGSAYSHLLQQTTHSIPSDDGHHHPLPSPSPSRSRSRTPGGAAATRARSTTPTPTVSFHHPPSVLDLDRASLKEPAPTHAPLAVPGSDQQQTDPSPTAESFLTADTEHGQPSQPMLMPLTDHTQPPPTSIAHPPIRSISPSPSASSAAAATRPAPPPPLDPSAPASLPITDTTPQDRVETVASSIVPEKRPTTTLSHYSRLSTTIDRRASRAPTVIPRSAPVTRADLRESARDIYERYFAPHAPKEIYLPPSLRFESAPAFDESHDDVVPDMYNAHKKYYFSQLESSAYPRFLRARVYSNLSPFTSILRLGLGILVLWIALSIALSFIFLSKHSRATRCWVILPFFVAFLLILTFLYELDPILLMMRLSESTPFRYITIREPFVFRLLFRRALAIIFITAVLTALFSVLFILVPTYRL